MTKLKIFASNASPTGYGLDTRIEEWQRKNKVSIVNVKIEANASAFVVVVLYTEHE